nr:threonine synthase [SAR86 cluster bacterium]
TLEEINNFENLTYQELTTKVLYPFVSGELSLKEFKDIVGQAYQIFESEEVVNLITLEKQRWILELFHGPTLAFKDIAMQLLAALLEHFVQKEAKKVAVLGATSGDTGSAAIAAFSRYKEVDVFILYPHQRVTEVQRLQMTTSQAKNVHALAVRTDFDGCQAIVKELFLDKSISSNQTRFIAANSINWTRCMTQSVYYFWTYLRLKQQLKELTFSVPSGNFGNAYAGWLAKEMGLPIKKIFVATNKNDVLHRLFSKNSYKKGEVSQTLAPSMDISVASNFERLLFNLCNNNSHLLKATMSVFPQNAISVPKESWEDLRNFFSSFSSSDEEILKEIEITFKNHNYILDPHTATGVNTSRKLSTSDQSVITMATAHPAKFMKAIKQVVPEKLVSIPNQLASIKDKKEDFVVLPDNIDKVREYILSSVS